MPAQASKFGENKQLYWYYIYYIDLGQTVGCPGKKIYQDSTTFIYCIYDLQGLQGPGGIDLGKTFGCPVEKKTVI